MPPLPAGPALLGAYGFGLQAIEQQLDAGLKAENPLDLWGSHDRFETRIEACLRALMQDPNVAACAFFSNFRDGYFLSEAIYRLAEKVGRESGKPLVLANCYSDLANTAICRRGYADGVAILDGTRAALLAFKKLFAYRDFKLQQDDEAASTGPAGAKVEHWTETLAGHAGNTLGESDALDLLADFSIPVVDHVSIASEAELLEAAARLGYPVVLKTAQPGLNHKSDSAGVFVGIGSRQELLRHYRDMSERLGEKALLSQMVESGIEIALGTVNDRHFGPVIMVAAGGVLVELLFDRVLAMCPVSAAQAATMLDSLKANRLLLGLRGRPAANRQALIDVIVKLSQLAYEMRDDIAEIDINPIIVTESEVLAVDALILCKRVDA